MAIFRVEVTAIARRTYTVDVEAPDEETAETVASSREIFGKNTPEEFQVDAKDCAFDFDSQQLTDECPECGESHAVMHDDLATCYCEKFVTQPNLPGYLRVHLLVDGVCTPAPWWAQDQEVCAACGAKIEAEEKAKEVARDAQ
jgi:predicted RNA-binding Zn-ribbon protein involved in translation (DUF1610 family)